MTIAKPYYPYSSCCAYCLIPTGFEVSPLLLEEANEDRPPKIIFWTFMTNSTLLCEDCVLFV